MTVDQLPRSEAFRDSPAVRLAKAHERRAAVRALAALSYNTDDFLLLLDMLELDPADGRADLEPLTTTPALPPPPDERPVVDLMPAGLRHLAPVSAPISPPQTRAPKVTPAPPPADGICPTDGCHRPYKHRGVHSQPRTETTPPADGICQQPGCDRPWKHRGRHAQPKPDRPTPADATAAYDQASELVDQAATDTPAAPRKWSNTKPTTARGGRQPNPFDPADAARRYLDGEPLFTLAADLHIGANTLRRALTDQGVQLRKRGEVITPRDSHARPLDVQQCLDLYATGLTTTDISRQLGVKTSRVQHVLRVAGVLRPPGGRAPGAGAVNSVRLKLGADLSDQVRLRAAALGKPISHYLRDLVLDDLAAAAGGDA